MTIMFEVLGWSDMALISRPRNVEIRPEIVGELEGGGKSRYNMAAARVHCNDSVIKLQV